MNKTEDRRTRRTKKALMDAFLTLLEKKPLKNISVREISELADINRSTFYLHYRDVYDMSEQLQCMIFEKFNSIVENYETQTETGKIFPVLSELFGLLADNASLAHLMLGKHGDAAFTDKLKEVIRKTCFADMQKVVKIQDPVDYDLFFQYSVSGCIGICIAWLNGGLVQSPDDMASVAEKIILEGAMGLS